MVANSMEKALSHIDKWRSLQDHHKNLLAFNDPMLKEMPAIPEECEELLFNNCGMTSFDKPFPSGLRVLVIRNCRSLLDVPMHFPDSITHLIIESCPFAQIHDKYHGYYHIYPSENNRLTRLPKSLTYLAVWQTGIVELPKQFPPDLEYLNLMETHLDDIPEFPEGLQTLFIDSGVELPYLPDSLERLYHDDFEQNFEDMDMSEDEVQEIHKERIQAANQMYEWPRSKARTLSRCAALKEDLMAAAWHPTRVSKWLEAGDDVYDMMCGAENTFD